MKTRLIGITMLLLAILAVSGVLYAQGVLQPGDGIDGMSVRSGGSQGPPIWAFCASAFPNPGVTTTECTVPPLPELAIGHGCFGADEARRDAMWNVQTWELYLDGQQVDLDAFGTYDADLATPSTTHASPFTSMRSTTDLPAASAGTCPVKWNQAQSNSSPHV